MRLDITFNVHTHFKYGIMLSGGIDSAVLLYLLLATAKEKNFKLDIQPFSMIKHDHSYKYVNSIIDYFNQQFDTTVPETVLVGNPNVHHRMQSTIATGAVFKNYPNIHTLFNGINQNPPQPWGNPDWEYPNRPAPGYTVKKMQFPFLHLYKTDIIDLMFKHSQEKLMDITHTCTELTDARCGQCFQCSERAWAFEQLGKIDTGKL
jgi:hypothetical protein